MATQAEILRSNREVRQAMEEYGFADDDEKVARSLRSVQSTVFFAAGAILTPQRFFQQAQVDGYWTNYSFPQNETAVDILGIQVIHTLKFASTPVDIQSKQQQLFEQSSWLRLTFQRRLDRIGLTVSDFVPHTFLNNGGALSPAFKPNSSNHLGFVILPTPLPIAAKATPEWLIDIPTGYTTAAADTAGADADPEIPGHPDATGYLMLRLLIEEKFVAQG